MAIADLHRIALVGSCLAVGLVLGTTSLEILSDGSPAAASIPMRRLNLISRLSDIVICNKDIFGQGLALNSCGDANQQMNSYSQVRQTWGPRDANLFDIGLQR